MKLRTVPSVLSYKCEVVRFNPAFVTTSLSIKSLMFAFPPSIILKITEEKKTRTLRCTPIHYRQDTVTLLYIYIVCRTLS